jgi:hypothetical protein
MKIHKHANANGTAARKAAGADDVDAALAGVGESRKRLLAALEGLHPDGELKRILTEILSAHGDDCAACRRALALLGGSAEG